jgi:hypothetical protein
MVSVLRVEIGWSGGMHELGFYSPKAVPRKERRDLRNGFDSVKQGRKSDSGLGRKKTLDRWDHGVSDGSEGNAAARSRGLLGHRLGSSQATKRYMRAETAHAETGDERATGSG